MSKWLENPEWTPDIPSGTKINKQRCDRCNKVLYNSKHEARHALTGGMHSKSIRVYECPALHGKFHVTKERLSRRRFS